MYMNRLLPEVLTSFNLHCVMSALDEHSYIVSEPLHLPPMSNDAVFESSKYPIVKFPGLYDETYDDDDVSMCEEKKDDDDDDAPIFGSTRETETISPFTAKGLLKLMEEHSSLGNDVSKVSCICCLYRFCGSKAMTDFSFAISGTKLHNLFRLTSSLISCYINNTACAG